MLRQTKTNCVMLCGTFFFCLNSSWNYWYSNGLDARAFHVVNVALHAVVCGLLYQVCIFKH